MAHWQQLEAGSSNCTSATGAVASAGASEPRRTAKKTREVAVCINPGITNKNATNIGTRSSRATCCTTAAHGRRAGARESGGLVWLLLTHAHQAAFVILRKRSWRDEHYHGDQEKKSGYGGLGTHISQPFCVCRDGTCAQQQQRSCCNNPIL